MAWIIFIGIMVAMKSFIFEAHFSNQESWMIAGSIIFVVYYLYLMVGYEIKNNRVYPFSPFGCASFANYFKTTAGIKWSSCSTIKSEKEGVLIDKFTFDRSVSNNFKSIMNFHVKSRQKEVRVKTTAFKRGSLIIGQMGAGKTEFLNNILHQNWYTRALIHDIKGDYVEKFYSRKDIILNPFDRRALTWDIFVEAQRYPQIIKPFFINLISGCVTQEKNFFTTSAADRYIHIFNEVLAQELNKKEAWATFINAIYRYFKTVENDPNAKSEKDVVSTMKLILEFFEYQNYLIQQDTKTFTIYDFLHKKNSKLFLLNKQTYSNYLTAYFNGFVSAFVAIFMDVTKDGTEELTLFLLDEYLSFLPIMDENTLTTLHTLIRSRGGCLFPAVQYVPEHDKKLTQKLLNSVDQLFIFQTADTATTEMISKIIGRVEYMTTSSNKNGNSDIENRTQASNQAQLLSDDILKGLGQDYSHITFIPSRKILYKGYTQMIELEKKHEAFIEAKYKNFILHKEEE